MEQSVQNLFNGTLLRLKAIYHDNEARAMADRLFEHYFNLTPAQRVISHARNANITECTEFEESIVNLLNNVPLQYVLGKAFFMDLELDVNPSVLIPRPETEELISLILQDKHSEKLQAGFNILDIGTGSGCIAIALKHYLPESVVSAIDISDAALGIAQANAVKNKATVTFIQADILNSSSLDSFSEFDLIVSNPPYVTHGEKQFMQSNVLDYEPHIALFVPDDDPLIFYRSIIKFSLTHLSPEGSLWFEINEMFGEALRDIALGQGFAEVNIIFDIRGKSRFLQCLKKIN